MDPTLCLNMIVKNESKIITRLLDSVVNLIDCYCICDTGSTDDTVRLIETYFEARTIPGKVVHEPFKDFCHNRNVALEHANGMSEFVLLLDADMVLDAKQFDKNTLRTADSFHIFQGHRSFYYQNLRIVRNNGMYRYVGVTHEYIDTPPGNRTLTIAKEHAFIHDIGDGGSKANKYERDIQLLLNGLQSEPNNVRYHFYLANSYHDLGRFQEAITYYKKRITLGGWFEEVWYSHYRIGMCFKRLGNVSEAFTSWLDGYNFYPERLEGLYEMIKHYREHSQHKLCKLYYDVAKAILDKKLNRDNYLFLHNDVYTYKLYYEYTIFSSYLGVRNINDEVVTVLNHSTDESVNNNLLSNMKFYKDILQPSFIHLFDNDVHKSVILGEQTLFRSSSSCLIPRPDGSGYIMNVRYVNYYIEKDGSYKNCEGHIITINKLVELDADVNTVKETWFDTSFDGRLYIGVEDVKIYYDCYTGVTRFIGTGYHMRDQLGIVEGSYEGGWLVPTELRQRFKQTSCEKNWVFVDYRNKTHIVYDWFPLTLCRVESNELQIVETRDMPGIFSKVRGSSCAFVYGEERWFVTHIVSYENPRDYYHLIAVFDSNMHLLRYSAPFKFEGEPIEYCLSIVVEDSRVLLNYSTWDRTTRIGVYEKSFIDSLLKYH